MEREIMPHIAIIEARFYEDIADKLLESAQAVLKSSGATFERIKVPGCFEIPAVLAMAFEKETFDGYVTLGCVIRGETSHYDYVCGESARGINQLAMDYGLAVGYGIITAENRQQAEYRANKEQKDVGGRAARACLDMLALKQQLEPSLEGFHSE
jgi:6,7-dimethyl-8-ribityllumazine synthase